MPLSLCLSLSTLVGLIITVVDTRIVGFGYSAWAAVLLCVLPGLGVWLGNLIRKWIMPDAVYGSTVPSFRPVCSGRYCPSLLAGSSDLWSP
ncbi:hypothetical protein LEADMM271B_16940 [Leclercia adecarboxylata]|nr:Uncharacterised protein [Enterobacter hormaechei]